MLNYKNILCPVDFDAVSLSVIPLAAALALESHTWLHLLHVARIPAQDMDSPVPMAPVPRWEKEAASRLQEIADKTLDKQCQYLVHVRSGIPDNDIVPFADQLGAELIVMATHGRKGFEHLMLGSVVESVTREANCPVLIIRPKPQHTPS
jgi:nucleotide-binding universal stress UspA family protein